MRTFLAIPLSPSAELAHLIRLLQTLGPDIRPVRTDQLHLTIKFLGETSEDQLAKLNKLILSGLSQFSGGQMQLRGLGFFPDMVHPRVLWAGIQSIGRLGEMAEVLDELAAKIQFPRERFKFQPHVTLARLNGSLSKETIQILRPHQIADFGEYSFHAINLYQSKLSSVGAEYRLLTSFPLKCSESTDLQAFTSEQPE